MYFVNPCSLFVAGIAVVSTDDIGVAYKQRPDDVVVMTNLATTLSRNDGVPEAIEITKRQIELTHGDPVHHFSLGTLLAPYNRETASSASTQLQICRDQHRTARPYPH